jgi:hypothetical protein
METLKQEAIEAISKMPDSSDVDDIMYRLYVIDKVRKGNAVPAQELAKEIDSW